MPKRFTQNGRIMRLKFANLADDDLPFWPGQKW
jgi:hypothetical protein